GRKNRQHVARIQWLRLDRSCRWSSLGSKRCCARLCGEAREDRTAEGNRHTLEESREWERSAGKAPSIAEAVSPKYRPGYRRRAFRALRSEFGSLCRRRCRVRSVQCLLQDALRFPRDADPECRSRSG